MKTKHAKSPPRRLRLLVVDDHPMTREGLVHFIGSQPDLVVCAEAGSAAEGLGAALRARPDLVLADINLPDKSGLEMIKDIKAVRPALPILVMSMHDESHYAGRALKAGAEGYIMKVAGGAKLLEAIRKVLAGEIVVSEKVSARLLKNIAGKSAGAAQSPAEVLSDREFEIFRLIAQGTATKQIATRLHLSPKTVETHRVRIKAKLDVTTAAELIAYAARWESELGTP